MTNQPWQSDRRCGSCDDFEIAGLGYCLKHVSQEDLAEAEAITGWRRCTTRRCREIATPTSDPATCPYHVQVRIEKGNRRAQPGFVNEAMAGQLAEILAEHGDHLLNPPPIGNPLDALEALAAEIVAFKQILAAKVATLSMDDWRYRHDRAGEQIRTELFLYERALDRCAKVLTNIAKLHIHEHRLELEREVAAMIERAFGLALEDSGADLIGQQRARDRLSQELATMSARDSQ
jgi:hypothetical protein